VSHAAGEKAPSQAASSAQGQPAPGAPAWPRAALLSLSDKRGAAEFAALLAREGTRLIASGGTAEHLRASGLSVTAVEDWTGFPELLGGRVKTLHPHVHAPILARRGLAADLAELRARKLEPIDLVAVTLYPFEDKGRTLDDAGMVEEIDIGGVALLRAAAKNHDAVIVLHDPSQYEEVGEALARGVTAAERRGWAMAAFRAHRALRRRHRRRAGAARGRGRRARPPWRCACSSVRARSATGRTRTSRRRSTSWQAPTPVAPAPGAQRRRRCARRRSSRTTTCSTSRPR
jgi:hypothetical protein